MNYLNTFYLDKEKDIRIDLYKDKDTVFYCVTTPNNRYDNLITNLARLTKQELSTDDKGNKAIKGELPCLLTSHNDEVYLLRFGGIKVANIDASGNVQRRAVIPAVCKVLMSQTTEYSLPVNKTIVKTYLPKSCKFKTDVHTHMNACLYPSILAAFGISRQIKYPLYYIKKLNLKLTDKQWEKLNRQREKVARKFTDSPLTGKKLARAIDDRTFINFADLILNNIENADYNLTQVRNSLTLLKDGQAVFTNLEKLYLYRYVFTKGQESERKIKLRNTEKIPQYDVLKFLRRMLEDKEHPVYKHNTLYQDLLLWIGRLYQRQLIEYVEIADTSLVKSDGTAFENLRQIHEIMPCIEEETGVKIRFLAALRRVPLTIIKTDRTPANYLKDCLDVLKVVARDPYVAGCDFVGEEINDILELKPVIKQVVKIAGKDPYFTVRIHAGENDSLTDNMYNSIMCVRDSLSEGQKMPRLRLGHGLCTPPLSSVKGKKLLKLIKDTGTVLEFQLTSNIRLNNLSEIEMHPLKTYLDSNIRCLQGTDGCGIYGTDTMDEQSALINLLGLNNSDMKKMVRVEEEIISSARKAFTHKSKKFIKFLKDRDIITAFNQELCKVRKHSENLYLDVEYGIDAREALKERLRDFPEDKIPVIIAGGSFNSDNRKTVMSEEGKRIIEELVSGLPDNYFFVLGHKLEGYENYLLKHLNKHECFAIVPAYINEKQARRLNRPDLGIVVSTESLGMGIYKSFNYEIFERRPSLVIVFDGNSAGANLMQEARNGKAESKIYLYDKCEYLRKKALSLQGCVEIFSDVSAILNN